MNAQASSNLSIDADKWIPKVQINSEEESSDLGSSGSTGGSNKIETASANIKTSPKNRRTARQRASKRNWSDSLKVEAFDSEWTMNDEEDDGESSDSDPGWSPSGRKVAIKEFPILSYSHS